MVCPLCLQNKGRRACPALGRHICAVCCGTKRLVEIQCPAGCSYLAAAREHPPAAQVRRQQQDVALLLQAMRDLNDRQSQLFVMTARFLAGYRPSGIHTLIDEDVAEASRAMAATYETASRGVIYEHPSNSAPAAELTAVLKPLFEKARGTAGTAFERDAAVVLRRVESAIQDAGKRQPPSPTMFVDMLSRVMRREGEQPGAVEEAPRLIVP